MNRELLSAVCEIRSFLKEKFGKEQLESGPFFTVSCDDVTVCDKDGKIVLDTLDPAEVLSWK